MLKSPFQAKPPKIRKKNSWREKIWSYLSLRGHESFVRSIPSDDIRDMPTGFVYGLGIVLFLILLSLFLVIFILSYQVQINTYFLSPLDDDTSTSASPYCETLTVANTATVRATRSGYWEGAAGFEYSEAVYLASVVNWAVTPEEYAEALDLLYLDIQEMGKSSKLNDLGYNLMYWFSYTALPEFDNSVQRFNLIGDPLTVFNRQYVDGTVSTVTGDCNLTSNALFNTAKGLLSMEYNYDLFINNPICNATGNPDYLGYLPKVNPNIYQIKFDVRSLITALAVNLRMNFLSNLVEITAFRSSYDYQGKILFNISQYYDPKYPGMSPITCITDTNTKDKHTNHNQKCVLIIGDSTFAIPIFNHLGNSTELPQKCICNEYTPEELSNRYQACNVFNLLAGFIYYPTNTPDAVIELILKYNLTARYLNDAAYPASFVSSYWGETSSYATTTFNDPTYRQELYDFCKISVGYCSLVTFSLFNENYDWAISSYYFQLLTGACQDQISTTYEDWQKLITNPFMPLIQDYQKCHLTPAAVFVNQLGVSMGNIAAITPIVVLVFLGILLSLQICTGRRIPVIYRKFERDRALNAFATSLLYLRDQKYYSDSIHPQENHHISPVMWEIIQQLEREAQLSNNPALFRKEYERMLQEYWQRQSQSQQQSSSNALQSPFLPVNGGSEFDEIEAGEGGHESSITNTSSNRKKQLRILNLGRISTASTMFMTTFQDISNIMVWLKALIHRLEEYLQFSSEDYSSTTPSQLSSIDRPTTTQARNIVTNHYDSSNVSDQSQIWFILHEIVGLQQIPKETFSSDLMIRKDFFRLVKILITYHIAIVTGLDTEQYHHQREALEEFIFRYYHHQYGYCIAGTFYSLAEIVQLSQEADA